MELGVPFSFVTNVFFPGFCSQDLTQSTQLGPEVWPIKSKGKKQTIISVWVSHWHWRIMQLHTKIWISCFSCNPEGWKHRPALLPGNNLLELSSSCVWRRIGSESQPFLKTENINCYWSLVLTPTFLTVRLRAKESISYTLSVYDGLNVLLAPKRYVHPEPVTVTLFGGKKRFLQALRISRWQHLGLPRWALSQGQVSL